SPPSPKIFRFIAPAFAAAGLFHLAALVWPQIAEPVPGWWHLLFVGVNAALTALVLRRPRGFLIFYVIYTAQQFIEHVPRGLAVWRLEHRIDWGSLASVVFVPCVLALLVRDARTRRAGPLTAAAQRDGAGSIDLAQEQTR